MAAGEDASLLRAMAELDGVSHGFSNVTAWQEAMTDYSGCHAPGNATRTLTALARSWNAASPCMLVKRVEASDNRPPRPPG